VISIGESDENFDISKIKIIYMDSILEDCDFITNYFRKFFYLHIFFDDSIDLNYSLDDVKEMVDTGLNQSRMLEAIYPIVTKISFYF